MMALHRITSQRRSGFSLTEILIVIALIVLILAMALPAFNFITGSRSTEAATNLIGAMLARARTEAVGVQEYRGIMFYVDPATDRQMLTLVKESPSPTAMPATIDLYLDASDSDHIPLPKGVGVQVIRTNGVVNASGQRQNDGYAGFNFINLAASEKTTTMVGGVILFDGYGRLATVRYAFRMVEIGSSPAKATAMTNLIAPTFSLASDSPQVGYSSLGFALFDEAAIKDYMGKSAFDYRIDPAYDQRPYLPPGPGTETDEENWIDNNADLTMINRYNGTLVKGQ